MNRKYKILIVEDEFLIANQLKMFLVSEGYNVFEPTNCYTDSISLIEKELPDLIITDIHLFDDLEGGINISRYVSKHYNIPVIFLSAYSDLETIQKAKDTNPNTFLIKPKPLDKSQLLTTVQMALPKGNFKNSKVKKVLLKGKDIKTNEIISEIRNRTEFVTRLIDTSEILYLETFNHQIKNTLLLKFANNNNAFIIREEIEDFLNILPHNFLRVHKSFVINAKRISGYRLPEYILMENYQIPVGEKYCKSLEFYFQDIK